MKRGGPRGPRPARTLAPAASPAPSAGRTATVAALAAVAACAIFTFRGATSVGFSQDDWLGLARAGGLAPRLDTPWRWLSHQAFWDVLVHAARGSAATGHAAVLVAHAASAALLAWLLSRRLPLAAAALGAAFFATHPALFTSLHWLAANGDVFATFLALVTAALVFARGRIRWLALPAFAAALACKESVLPLPLALAAVHAFGPGTESPRPRPWRDPVLLALGALAAVGAVVWAAGARGPALGGEAYATSLASVAPNALTYDGWAGDRWFGTVRGVSDAIDRTVWPWGLALNAVALAGLFVPALRRRGWAAAVLAYICLLLPVLPLRSHTMHYYLTPALPAVALLIAAGTAPLFERARPPVALAAALLAAAWMAWDGAALVERIRTAPFLLPELRADATVDRANIAANALAALEAAHLPTGTKLAFWSPASREVERARGGDASQETYFERNVRAALLEGLAVRVRVPNVDRVRFTGVFDSTATGETWAVYGPDGQLRVASTAELTEVVRRSMRSR